MKICYSVEDINVERDVWTTLAKTQKPIVMYGMGNGADKILAVFDKYGIKVADFFASDGFVRHQTFHGKTVLSYAEICEKYDDFIITVSFGTRLDEVLSNIYRLGSERELYAPDVPVVSGELFDLDFFNAHKAELSAACELLSDDLSKQTFCDVILFRLTGKLEYLRRHTVLPDAVFGELLGAESFTRTVDLGAYNGDSIKELAEFAPKLCEVTAFEPDEKNFKKLTALAQTTPYTIKAHNLAAWNNESTLEFTSGGNRNSTLLTSDGVKTGARLKVVHTSRLDAVFDGNCDYIKYDVEGAEYNAILGSRETIGRSHPKLLVSMYHKNEDLYELPRLIHELGYKKLCLRRYEYIPAWDLNLLAIE